MLIIPVGIAVPIIVLLFAATPALKTNATNTARANDASALAAAVAEYENSHKNALPQSAEVTGQYNDTVLICGTSCTDGTQVSASMGYDYKNPTKVSFHPYANGLSVPDSYTIYLVNNASCSADKSSLGGQVANSVAILYSTISGRNLIQHCLSV